MANAALGTAAVLGAIAAFGSFGVPIKSRRLQDAQVKLETKVEEGTEEFQSKLQLLFSGLTPQCM